MCLPGLSLRQGGFFRTLRVLINCRKLWQDLFWSLKEWAAAWMVHPAQLVAQKAWVLRACGIFCNQICAGVAMFNMCGNVQHLRRSRWTEAAASFVLGCYVSRAGRVCTVGACSNAVIECGYAVSLC